MHLLIKLIINTLCILNINNTIVDTNIIQVYRVKDIEALVYKAVKWCTLCSVHVLTSIENYNIAPTRFQYD